MAPSRAMLNLPLRYSSHAYLGARPISHFALSPNLYRTICIQHTVNTQLSQTHRSFCSDLRLKRARNFPAFLPFQRSYSTAVPEPPDYLNDRELHVFNKIRDALEPVQLEVQDISGGCGSMYAVEIVSSKFKGLSVIKQHKMVNEVLKDEIAGWHGVQLKTRAV
ncbi:bola-like protein [Periconia macrospinosa]|uniref:Bola-like protein n=1 Tax=Periconia macrospinosa TaxID=97972 RepID=A0A2V1E772_9PLEO|nr:bola-like protein [Periconia macrospinosa]